MPRIYHYWDNTEDELPSVHEPCGAWPEISPRWKEFIFILQMAILISMPNVPPTRRVYLQELRTAMRISVYTRHVTRETWTDLTDTRLMLSLDHFTLWMRSWFANRKGPGNAAKYRGHDWIDPCFLSLNTSSSPIYHTCIHTSMHTFLSRRIPFQGEGAFKWFSTMIRRHSKQFHTPLIFTMLLLGNVWAYATPTVHTHTQTCTHNRNCDIGMRYKK